jgi:hypothetical protein
VNVCSTQKGVEHASRRLDVGYDPVAKGPDDFDALRPLAGEGLSHGIYGSDLARRPFKRDHRRLLDDEATASHVDEGAHRPSMASPGRKRIRLLLLE